MTGPEPAAVPRERGTVWVVAGAPGAGKSTVAALLAGALDPAPAWLDKDVLFGGLTEEILRAHGRDPGEREGEWYDAHVKRHEYAALTRTAARIRGAGTPVLLDAPFTGQIRDPARWRDWIAELGGEPVTLVWVRTDPDTLRSRLLARGDPKDGGKLAAYAAFVARMRPDTPPPAPHDAVDNRPGAPELADQVARLARRGRRQP